MYRGHKYVLTFPDEWILNEKEKTGRECTNCVNIDECGIADGFGMWRGIIIGYCMNCADYDYGYSRGYGFQGQAVENIPVIVDSLVAAMHTYLLLVDLGNLGNLEMNPIDTIANHTYLCEIHEKLGYLEYMKNEDEEDYDSPV